MRSLRIALLVSVVCLFGPLSVAKESPPANWEYVPPKFSEITAGPCTAFEKFITKDGGARILAFESCKGIHPGGGLLVEGIRNYLAGKSEHDFDGGFYTDATFDDGQSTAEVFAVFIVSRKKYERVSKTHLRDGQCPITLTADRPTMRLFSCRGAAFLDELDRFFSKNPDLDLVSFDDASDDHGPKVLAYFRERPATK